MIKSFKHNLALKLDSIGFVASALCAIHCAAMPFVFIFLTMYGFQFIANPLIEIIFIASSFLIGTYTFRHGYFNHHKKLYPFLIFLSGLTIVIAGHYVIKNHNHNDQHSDELILLIIPPIGAFLISIGHYLNRKLSKNIKTKVCSC